MNMKYLFIPLLLISLAGCNEKCWQCEFEHKTLDQMVQTEACGSKNKRQAEAKAIDILENNWPFNNPDKYGSPQCIRMF